MKANIMDIKAMNLLIFFLQKIAEKVRKTHSKFARAN